MRDPSEWLYALTAPPKAPVAVQLSKAQSSIEAETHLSKLNAPPSSMVANERQCSKVESRTDTFTDWNNAALPRFMEVHSVNDERVKSATLLWLPSRPSTYKPPPSTAARQRAKDEPST